MVLWRTRSVTATSPWATRVSVPAHVSCTSHCVPRTVAALYWPDVRKLPWPLPHSRRDLTFFFLAAADAAPLARGHVGLGPDSVSWVIEPGCVTVKMPA